MRQINVLHDYTLYCMYTHIFAYLSIISVVLTIPLTSRLCLAVDYHGLSVACLSLCPWLGWMHGGLLGWLVGLLPRGDSVSPAACMAAHTTQAPRYGHAARTTENTTRNTTGSQPFPATSRSAQPSPYQPSHPSPAFPHRHTRARCSPQKAARARFGTSTAKHKNKRPGTRHPHRHSTPDRPDSQAASTRKCPGTNPARSNPHRQANIEKAKHFT